MRTRCRSNLLAQFDPSEAKHIIPEARDPNRRWYGVYTVYTTPAYNTEAGVKPDELPKSFEEFAQRKEWAGKVAIDHTDIEWLRGMMQFYGEQKGTALVREIAANLKPVLTDGRLAMARSVAAGEYLFALNNFVNLTLNVKLAGGAIDFFPLDPVPLYFAQVAVNASAPNPNTARLAANFMLSRECQVFYTQVRAAADAQRRGDQPARHHQAGHHAQGGPHAVLAGRGEAAAADVRHAAAQR